MQLHWTSCLHGPCAAMRRAQLQGHARHGLTAKWRALEPVGRLCGFSSPISWWAGSSSTCSFGSVGLPMLILPIVIPIAYWGGMGCPRANLKWVHRNASHVHSCCSRKGHGLLKGISWWMEKSNAKLPMAQGLWRRWAAHISFSYWVGWGEAAQLTKSFGAIEQPHSLRSGMTVSSTC